MKFLKELLEEFGHLSQDDNMDEFTFGDDSHHQDDESMIDDNHDEQPVDQEEPTLVRLKNDFEHFNPGDKGELMSLSNPEGAEALKKIAPYGNLPKNISLVKMSIDGEDSFHLIPNNMLQIKKPSNIMKADADTDEENYEQTSFKGIHSRWFNKPKTDKTVRTAIRVNKDVKDSDMDKDVWQSELSARMSKSRK